MLGILLTLRCDYRNRKERVTFMSGLLWGPFIVTLALLALIDNDMPDTRKGVIREAEISAPPHRQNVDSDTLAVSFSVSGTSTEARLPTNLPTLPAFSQPGQSLLVTCQDAEPPCHIIEIRDRSGTILASTFDLDQHRARLNAILISGLRLMALIALFILYQRWREQQLVRKEEAQKAQEPAAAASQQ
ncbi:MAG: hypothetical protein Q4E06_07570 [Lautropia sp.]|nr:hypothetical protein [Lautropia sp.]